MSELEKQIAAGVPQGPPTGLRQRVLTAAREAAGQASARDPWWWRPAVRWAWAGVTAVLLAANLLVGTKPRPMRTVSGAPQAVALPAVGDPLIAAELARYMASRQAQTTALRPVPDFATWMQGAS